MGNLVKEIEELLEKYDITITDLVEIYTSSIKGSKVAKRLTQCYDGTDKVWCYYDGQERNPCGCGSNCYHYEYDEENNKIYGVCNSCKTIIYEVKDEYISEKLLKGVWLYK